MKDDLLLSEEHGVNPGLEQCFWCGEAKGVILWGRIGAWQADELVKAGLSVRGGNSAGGDVEAPRYACLDRHPCGKCMELMQRGIILISVNEEKTTDRSNPYRSGGWVVLTEDAVRRMPVEDEVKEKLLEMRGGFFDDAVWDAFGLPRGAQDGQKESSDEDHLE